MTHPTIRFPLRITEVGEAIAVLDAVRTHCSYIYFCDEPDHAEALHA
jgi:hypothetical protein